MDLSLWDIIRDFFVQYVFGGVLSDGTPVSGTVGYFYSNTGEYGNYGNVSVMLPINSLSGDEGWSLDYISLSDWLSTTATIITLCLLLFAVLLGIKFLFKLVAGSFLKIGE